MRNVCWSPCVLLFFFFISTSLCVASDQITSNSPSLHDGDATVKHMSTTISNVKSTQSVGSRRAYGGRRMKTDDERVNYNQHVNLQEGDEMKRDSKYEASKQPTMAAAKRIRARKQQLKTTDMDSFVSYADYPGPRHHPPKNN